MNLRRLIREELRRLQEVEITDPDLISEIEEYARLAEEMDRLKAQLAEIDAKYKTLDAKFVQMLEQLEREVGNTKETFIRAKNILITIKPRGKTDAVRYQYKEAFDWLYSKVSPQMKKLIDESMELNKTVYQIKSSLAVQREGRIRENWLTSLYNKVKSFVANIIGKLRKTNQSANSALDKLEEMI